MVLQAVSLFSGCGGLDLGLEKAGFEIVFASDVDSRCAESHQSNFPRTPFVQASIDDLLLENSVALEQLQASHVDLVIGGPPCPPFSKSRFYRTEMPRALEDPEGLLTVSGYFDVVDSLRPRAFLFENVPGIAYKAHADALSYVLSRAHAAGYQTTSRVLNAADFGVPQTRERFFLVGTLDRAFEFPPATHSGKSQPDLFESSLAQWRTAHDAIGDLDTIENENDAGHFAGGKHNDLLKEIPPGDNYLFFTEKRGHPNPRFEWRSRYWSFLLKLDPDRPSWTIQARRSNNMGPLHWKNRILRIEEIKRLQTFPDSWKLAGTVEEQWRQVGNAVPPMLAEALGRAIRDHLLSADPIGPRAKGTSVH